MKRGKWWIFLIPLLVIASVLVCVFWDIILLHAAPKVVLSGALSKLYSQMEERVHGNPLLLLADHFDMDGRYVIQMQVDTANELVGDIHYDMEVSTELDAHKISGEGTVSNSGKNLNLSFYLDDKYMAVSSEDLLRGTYYGITYDTFASDIQSIPLFSLMIREELLDKLDSSVQSVKEAMNRSVDTPDFSDVSADDIRKIIKGVILLPGRISREEMTILGEQLKCYKVQYEASGDQIDELLGMEGASISASFYLHDNVIRKMELVYAAGNEATQCNFLLGADPMVDPLQIEIDRTVGEQKNSLSAYVLTQIQAPQYAEKWSVSYGTESGNGTFILDYDWNTSTGDIRLTVNEKETVHLNLTENEAGIQIYTDDFSEIIRIFLKSKKKTEHKSSCTMLLCEGREVVSPVYKNVDQWSLEDFLILLEGIGGLFGLRQ